MSQVFVVDQERRPQRPVHPGYARWLLSHGKAAVLHRAPFTLILKRSCPESQPTPLRLKMIQDPKRRGWRWWRMGPVRWCGQQSSRIGESRSSMPWISGVGHAGVGSSGIRGIGSHAFATACGSQGGSRLHG
jgi:hypothetical protein